MNKILGFIALFFLTACASRRPDPYQEYIVFLNQRPYDFSIQTTDTLQEIKTSAIGGSKIELVAHARDVNLKSASRRLGKDKWFVSDYPELLIQEVTLVPYFSIYSYRILAELKNTGLELLDPACPLETKFLVVFLVGRIGIPWAGCVV